MRTGPVGLLQMVLRVTFLLILVLGIPIWTGKADGLIPLHMLLGFVFVLALWGLAYLAAQAGAAASIVLLAVVWGLITPLLGLSQEHVLPGSSHWLIQVVHLLVGLVAVALGERLGMLARSRDKVVAAQSR